MLNPPSANWSCQHGMMGGVDIDVKWGRICRVFVFFSHLKYMEILSKSPWRSRETGSQFLEQHERKFSYYLLVKEGPLLNHVHPEKDYGANVLALRYPLNFPRWKSLSFFFFFSLNTFGKFSNLMFEESTRNLEDGICVLLLQICPSEWLQ